MIRYGSVNLHGIGICPYLEAAAVVQRQATLRSALDGASIRRGPRKAFGGRFLALANRAA